MADQSTTLTSILGDHEQTDTSGRAIRHELRILNDENCSRSRPEACHFREDRAATVERLWLGE